MTTSQRRWRVSFPLPRTATAALAIGLALASVFTIPATLSAAYFTDEKALSKNSVTTWSMPAPTISSGRNRVDFITVEIREPFSDDWAKSAGIDLEKLSIQSPNCKARGNSLWQPTPGGGRTGKLSLDPKPAGTTCEIQFAYDSWTSPIISFIVPGAWEPIR